MVEDEIRAKIAQLKKSRRNALMLFWTGWTLWFVETIIFMALYGYHTTPANLTETVIDYVSGTMMMVGFIYIIQCMWKLDQFIIEVVEDDE